MDIRSIPVSQLVAINRATHGQLHDALAGAWDTYDADAVDVQVTHRRGTFIVQITGLVGDRVVYERVIEVAADRGLPEAGRVALLLAWVSTIQARVGRALARADAVVAFQSGR
jgi:hypothetical protein